MSVRCSLHILTLVQEYWGARKSFFTDAERANAWEETAGIVQTYSDEMVQRMKDEIDTLLVYVSVSP